MQRISVNGGKSFLNCDDIQYAVELLKDRIGCSEKWAFEIICSKMDKSITLPDYYISPTDYIVKYLEKANMDLVV